MGVTSIATLILESQGQYLLKQYPDGRLGFLGGAMNWVEGFPWCFEDRIREQCGLDLVFPGDDCYIKKRFGLNAILQDVSPHSQWRHQLNFYWRADELGMQARVKAGKRLELVDVYDVLTGKLDDRLAFPHMKALALYAMSQALVPSSFVHMKYVPGGYIKGFDGQTTLPMKTHELAVAGAVIYNPYLERYALVKCARGGAGSVGKRSLCGGTMDLFESFTRLRLRELVEELYGYDPKKGKEATPEAITEHGRNFIPLGLVGVWGNYIGDGLYVINTVPAFLTKEERFSPDPDEIAAVEWVTIDEARSLPLRTPDVIEALEETEQRLLRRDFVRNEIACTLDELKAQLRIS